MSDPATEFPSRSLAPRSVADVLRSCAAPLGVPVGYLEVQRVASVLREAGDEAEVRTFARGAVALVSLPSVDVHALDLDESSVQELIALTRNDASPGSIVVVNGVRLEIDEDPASLLAADAGTIDTSRRFPPAALVYDPKPTVLDMLRNDVSREDWAKGGGDLESPHRVGALAGGALVALASVETPLHHTARVRVVVARGQRRRGLGRLVLSTLATNVLRQGLIPHARLAHGDAGARALAASVGFVPFARTLTLRVSTVSDQQPAGYASGT